MTPYEKLVAECMNLIDHDKQELAFKLMGIDTREWRRCYDIPLEKFAGSSVDAFNDILQQLYDLREQRTKLKERLAATQNELADMKIESEPDLVDLMKEVIKKVPALDRWQSTPYCKAGSRRGEVLSLHV